MNLDQARFNMVEQQIRPWDVLAPAVLDAILNTPRHHFVAESQQTLAYTDVALPIGEGQRMMEPRLEAKMVQALDLKKNETILEIGTGSGYVTALLCKLGASVRSIDYFESLAEQAKSRLLKEKIGNSIIESGDAFNPQWSPVSDYDVVVITGAITEVPGHIQAHVKPGGRLFAIIEKDGVKTATVMTRFDQESWVTESLFETEADRVIAPATEAFSF